MKRKAETRSGRHEGLSRRELLGLLGATAAVSLVGGGAAGAPGETSRPACVVRPEQTEGPYFLDQRLERSDLRTDALGGSVVAGAPLALLIRVFRIDGAGCAPLPGAVVDLWQCDALGVYSGFRDFNEFFDTRGRTFLRGFQVTDEDGTARFTTIYPGWYPGRAVHIHFKVRTDAAGQRGHEHTSQLYFDDALTDRVHARPPYREKAGRRRRNADDGIFRRGGDQLTLDLTEEEEGYAATFDIGLELG